ncbi:MAG: hypothetical protein KDA21_09885, partial [Phycisphaerales bacterium]|nr:hypothetical protein [Phycisphaerales bacterium]
MGENTHEKDTRDLRQVIGSLRALRRRARLLLVTRRVTLLLTGLLLALILLGVTDYVFRLPRSLRIFHWFTGVGIILFLAWRYLLPGLRFCPRLTDLALRIEEREPDLRGYLASAIDFAEHGDGTRPGQEGLSAGLVQGVLRRAGELWSSLSVRHVLDRGGVIQATSFLTLAVALGAILYATASGMWLIGAQRQAWPFQDASWPRRTGVADATTLEFHPRGTALPLQAEVTRANRPMDEMNVAVRYRYVNEDGATQPRRELLTWQGRAGGDASGAIFERLVETSGETIEYRFETDDDATPWRRIKLIEPPAIVGARARLTPPAYAQQATTSEQAAWTRTAEVDLGPGADERAVAPTVLAGTRVDMTVDLIKPVDIPADARQAILEVDPEASFEAAGSTWTLAWTLNASTRMPLRLVDEYGIESVDDATYRFEAVQDRPAEATMTRPVTDQDVLPTAVVELAAEGRDDVGLSWIGIEQAMARPAEAAPGSEPSGPGGAMEPRGEPQVIARIEVDGRRQSDLVHELDLSVLSLRPGDEVYIAALATDIYRATSTA